MTEPTPAAVARERADAPGHDRSPRPVPGWEQSERRPPTTMLRAAVRPRMLVLLVLLLAAAAVCARLGAWQLDRAQVHGAAAAERLTAELVAAPAVPLDDVLVPQTTFTGELVGRKVTTTGTYDADGQLLVTGRAHDGTTGLLVLTPLTTTDGAVLPVVRGWVATPADADAPPAGSVDVTGYLQASEQAGTGVADGQTDAISSAELLNSWGGPIYTGYLVVASSDPAQADSVALLDPPTKPGAGLSIQNLAYAAQWWIFGGFAVLLWLRLVRDEARGSGAEPELTPEAGGAAAP
ncbi:SURF1 family protein [Cellulomonas xylanilytica]|uniref:SURF1-like protein n=1 Tax=Cellulomonas xylanilytica TaxID=233583 RepID=A0A510VAE1_9CELL|nr:SURF1 family protein [Cellulomonas xylanilytica]GEK22220.1 SURF1-like protein [Cellulomonas xylanilytica]